MKLSQRYNAAEAENKWYKHWEENGYFKSIPDEREPFTIVIPPPNVTGVLHMGHMLNNTIQDVLMRKARLDGKNACWVPGTDHASIATEAKVVALLREQGIKKSDLTRDEFMEHAWGWKEKYGGIILQQLRKLGASCDWDRTAFTMDEVRSKAVLKAFVDLYKKGKIYRGLRMINWDPAAKTVLSNEEVIYNDENGHLYHLKYQIEGTDEFLVIATTRPETILGDTAVAVHPDDPRYTKLKGKKVIVPLINRSIPVIHDSYVDMEFGTGALKITPAHDMNDYEIGKRHNLEVIDIFNDDATISKEGVLYIGEDRFDVRKKIKKALDEAGSLLEIEDYRHSVGRSERSNAVVEPKLSDQWYVDMKSITEPALKHVMNDDIEFFPKNQKNTYRHWLENIRDWCVSRQLWWGHRIPAYTYDGEIYVEETRELALAAAISQTGNNDIKIDDLKQDDDVLDTWFSSWLWPISVFDGFNNKEEIDYYYPTSVLVTGWDIIFLWVARMVMAGYEWKGELPFKHVYFTGMVRDKQRRKMSKSLGNSPDALKLIEDFGADGVRFGMLSCSPAGGDLLFEEKLVDQGAKFANKIWSALNLVKMWEIDDNMVQPNTNSLAIDWFNNKTNKVIADLANNYEKYRLSDVLMQLYGFIWNDFCSWYLEMIKPEYKAKQDRKTIDTTIEIFEKLMVLLHPFMPFLTEEVYHQLSDRTDDCMMASYPKGGEYDEDLLKEVDNMQDIISNVRKVRSKNGLKKHEPYQLHSVATDDNQKLMSRAGLGDLLCKMAALSEIVIDEDKSEKEGYAFVSGIDKFTLLVEQNIDVESEIKRLEDEIKYEEGFIISVEKKLGNAGFVKGAPEAVVNNEKKKLSDGQDRLVALKGELKKYK